MKGRPNRTSGKKNRSVLVPKLRRFTHEGRLRSAHQISARIVEKYGSDVMAVYVYGSTSKKLDRPYSDLEMIVAVRDRAEIPMKSYLHRGLIIHIQYLKSPNILDAAEQFTGNWHWEATSTEAGLLFTSGRGGSESSTTRSRRMTKRVLLKRFESRS